MDLETKKEFQELKNLTKLGARGRVLTLDDVCILTNLSKSHLYKCTHNKTIPHFKSQGGKHLFFDRADIENWCLNHRVKTSAEIEQEAVTYTVTGKRKGVQHV